MQTPAQGERVREKCNSDRDLVQHATASYRSCRSSSYDFISDDLNVMLRPIRQAACHASSGGSHTITAKPGLLREYIVRAWPGIACWSARKFVQSLPRIRLAA